MYTIVVTQKFYNDKCLESKKTDEGLKILLKALGINLQKYLKIGNNLRISQYMPKKAGITLRYHREARKNNIFICNVISI